MNDMHAVETPYEGVLSVEARLRRRAAPPSACVPARPSVYHRGCNSVAESITLLEAACAPRQRP